MFDLRRRSRLAAFLLGHEASYSGPGGRGRFHDPCPFAALAEAARSARIRLVVAKAVEDAIMGHQQLRVRESYTREVWVIDDGTAYLAADGTFTTDINLAAKHKTMAMARRARAGRDWRIRKHVFRLTALTEEE